MSLADQPKSTLHGSLQLRNMKASQLIAQNTQESSAELLHEMAELLDKLDKFEAWQSSSYSIVLLPYNAMQLQQRQLIHP